MKRKGAQRRATAPPPMAHSVAVFITSVIIAVLLSRIGVFETILAGSIGIRFLGNVLAGIFFTSLVTTGPATFALASIAQHTSLPEVVIIGSIGAVIGDVFLFRFLKKTIVDEFTGMMPKRGSFAHWVKRVAVFHWMVPAIGVLGIAWPFLPDEVALAVMGAKKISMTQFILLAFMGNIIGVTIVALVARALI